MPLNVRPSQIIAVIVGFILVVVITPIGMNYLYGINSTFSVVAANGSGSFTTAATWAPVFTMFNILLPVLYIVGVALYFVPKIGKSD